MSEKIVYICHCIDTEGPLYETPEETVKRINYIFKTDLKYTPPIIEKLKRQEINLGGVERQISAVLKDRLTNFLSTWDQIDKMLDKAMSREFRNRMVDSFGEGWVYNWHCVDHVGYEDNPRRRDMGHHNIFDHYQQKLQETHSDRDRIEWHYHPMSIGRKANTQGTLYVNSPRATEILCRKIIERKWFPSVNRAGFHVERPDSHWFLEQWIPYDISSLAKDKSDNDIVPDASDSRYGDWRFAPKEWTTYHPSHDNYQTPGNCRRSIGRILNIGTRYMLISQEEVDNAFARAQKGLPTLLAMTDHDFKDITIDVEEMRGYVEKSAEKYPDVKFKFSDVLSAFRAVANHKDENPEGFNLSCELAEQEGKTIFSVKTDGEIFGPQPFLAIETKDFKFIHDNFDFYEPNKEWHYYFDEWTIPIHGVKRIGVATNDSTGKVFINVLDLVTDSLDRVQLNM